MKSSAGTQETWKKTAKVAKRKCLGFLASMAVAFGLGAAVPFSFACTSAAAVALPYDQSFDQPLGAEWTSRGGGWRVVNGRLFNDGAHNVPLWLSAALPHDVAVSFTAESRSTAVDIKCEIYGDGAHHASGYVVILAGWNNSRSIIARLDEHAPLRGDEESLNLRNEVAADREGAQARHRHRRDIVQRTVHEKARHLYSMRIERRGNELRFLVDGALHLEYFDPSPLGGSGHDRFAFNNWESEVYFDDLRIEPL